MKHDEKPVRKGSRNRDPRKPGRSTIGVLKEARSSSGGGEAGGPENAARPAFALECEGAPLRGFEQSRADGLFLQAGSGWWRAARRVPWQSNETVAACSRGWRARGKKSPSVGLILKMEAGLGELSYI